MKEFDVENQNRINKAVIDVMDFLEEFDNYEILSIAEGLKSAVMLEVESEKRSEFEILQKCVFGQDGVIRVDPSGQKESKPRAQDKWVKEVLGQK